MKSIIKYCLICVYLFKSFSGSASTGRPLAYADSLFSVANYRLAALEYERAFYFSRDANIKALALLRKSWCLKNLQQFDKAAQSLQRITIDNLSNIMQFKIRYEYGLDCYLAGNFVQAEAGMTDIDYHTSDAALVNRALFLKILIKNELLKWNETDSLLKAYIKINSENADTTQLPELLKKPRLKNPKTAKILLYIIPGSGQIYTCHLLRGLSSITFQGVFLGYAIESFSTGFYISSIISGLGIFQVFYFGGARYAYFLAEKNNAKKIKNYNNKIKDFLTKTERKKL